MNENALRAALTELLNMDIDMRDGFQDEGEIIVKSVGKTGDKIVVAMSDFSVFEISIKKLT